MTAELEYRNVAIGDLYGDAAEEAVIELTCTVNQTIPRRYMLILRLEGSGVPQVLALTNHGLAKRIWIADRLLYIDQGGVGSSLGEVRVYDWSKRTPTLADPARTGSIDLSPVSEQLLCGGLPRRSGKDLRFKRGTETIVEGERRWTALPARSQLGGHVRAQGLCALH